MANERKHVAMTEKTHNEFKMIAKIKGMTHQGLMDYFIKKELEGVK